MTTALEIAAVALGYLIGAVPTAYLLVRAVKGTDIRTLGSGNVGATNAGRALGAWGFLTVFVIDLLKGFLPTWGLPLAVESMAGTRPPSLAVLVGVAAILGHNFPVYLGFKGGKGVATSLGVVIALDPPAAGAAAFAFATLLLVTRIVSLSSLLAGVVFALVHFRFTPDPWSREHATLSAAVLVLLALLFIRHRANLVRIARGTEPRVRFRRKPQSGRVGVVLTLLLAAIAAGIVLAQRVLRPAELDCGRFSLVATDRVSTGHQRAERVAFCDGGRLLAVTCPRYDRLVLLRVTPEACLVPHRDVRLAGKPVAVWPTSDRIYVLQRPSGDARHLEPGFWQIFDFEGRSLAPKFAVGYDPDDLALTAGDRVALVLLSGHAEGETNRPDPSLVAIDVAAPGGPRVVSELRFDRPGDDPATLRLSARESHAAVVLRGTNEVAGIDLADPRSPRLTGRAPLAEPEVPYVSTGAGDRMLMPLASGRDAVAVSSPGASSREAPAYVVSSLPDACALEVAHVPTRKPLGRLPLRGPANLGSAIPMGLAYCPERALIAVADRAGGVHLVALRGDRGGPAGGLVAAEDRAIRASAGRRMARLGGVD